MSHKPDVITSLSYRVLPVGFLTVPTRRRLFTNKSWRDMVSTTTTTLRILFFGTGTSFPIRSLSLPVSVYITYDLWTKHGPSVMKCTC